MGVGDRFGKVGEELRHFGGSFEMALGVAGEQASGFGERRFVMEAGEDIEDFALEFCGVADSVGGDEGQVEGTRASSMAAWLRDSSSRSKWRWSST